jgi:acyl-CoA reductase-like NAD-dependent aldehyde dehydrogenase
MQCGGPNGDGRLKPTVLTNVSQDMKVCRNEVFEPLVCVLKAADLDQVMNRPGFSGGSFV